jgi:hypothetical protein
MSNSCLFAQEDAPAKVILFRPSMPMAAAVVFKVHFNDTQFIRMMNRSYYQVELPAGNYTFKAGNKLIVKVKSGKTYFIRIMPIIGFWATTGELFLVDSNMAAPVITQGNLRDLRFPLKRPLNRINVAGVFGPGLDQISALQTTDGKIVSMSFGGGAGINVFYGREVSKRLDLSGGFHYQRSSLSPPVKNASMSFSRMGASFTAALIIPIQGGSMQRVKLGIGPDMYLKNILKFDFSQIDSVFKDTWDYKMTTGLHVNAIYELNLNDYFSFMYGLQLSFVNYDFKSGKVIYPVYPNPFVSAKGSAFEFLMGINVHF